MLTKHRLVALGGASLLATASLTALVATAQAAPTPFEGRAVFALTAGGTQLTSFDLSNPSLVRSPVAISGVDGRVVGIDINPADGALYAVGKSAAGLGKLYMIDKASAVATEVPTASGDFTLGASSYDIDVNPCAAARAGAIRILGDNGENLRIPLSTKVVNRDTALSFGAGTDDPAASPNVVGGAYTNPNTNGPCTPGTQFNTTLYDVDSDTDSLYVQTPPDSGTLTLQKPLALPDDAILDLSRFTGFDITPENAGVLTTLAEDGVEATTLYTLNVTTGVTSLVGTVSGPVLDAIAVDQTPAPAPVLRYSLSNTRSNPIALTGQTVSGIIYPFTLLTAGSKPVTSVDYSITNSAGTSVYSFNDARTPFDLRGTNNSNANPLNTAQVPNGSYTFTQIVNFTDGTRARSVGTLALQN